MREYFYAEENPHNSYYVKLNPEHIPGFRHEGGSLILIGAGILNMGYADYLRMCRDVYDGELFGKNNCYPGVRFKNKKDALRLCALLNPVMDIYVEYRRSLGEIPWREREGILDD